MYLLIHAELNSIHVSKRGPRQVWELSVWLCLYVSSRPLCWFSNSTCQRNDRSVLKCCQLTDPSCVNMPRFSFLVAHRLCGVGGPRGRFKKIYALLNLRDLKFSHVNKMHVLQCMGKYFVWNLKGDLWNFTVKYLTHTLKDAIFI